MATLSVLEVFSHVRLIHENEAVEKSWAFRIAATATNGTEKSVGDLFAEIRTIGDFGKRRRDALEVVQDDGKRLEMIGTLLKKSREGWLKSSSGQRWSGWLVERGFSEADAIAASDARLAEVLADPFFAKSKKG